MSNAYAIVAGQVWDGVEGAARPGMAVLVEGDRIAKVVAAEAVPPSLERIELPDCTLMPGLIDAHVHYSECAGAAFLAAGVTSVRDVGNELDWILNQRALNGDEPGRGPGIVCCGPLLDGPKGLWRRMRRAHQTADEIRASVRELVDRGVDQIKLYADVNLELMTAAIDEAHRLDKFVLAHLGIPAEAAIEVGLNEFEHLSCCEVAWRNATVEEDDAFIDLLLAKGVVIVPTFVIWDRLGRILDRSFYHDSRRAWAHPSQRDSWNRFPSRFAEPTRRLAYQEAGPHLKRFMRRAHERGVTVGLGTDTPFPHIMSGFSVHDEMALYVDAGLRPVDALRAATSVNAKVLGAETRIGKIEPGFAADLIAVKGDPLNRIEDIENLEFVVRQGERLNLDELSDSMRTWSDRELHDPVTDDLVDYVGRAG